MESLVQCLTPSDGCPPSSPLCLGHSCEDLSTEPLTGPLASFNSTLSQKCPIGTQPSASLTRVRTHCATRSTSFGEGQKTMAVWARRECHSRRLASCPQACAALSRQQMYRTPALWPAGGQVPPHCHHCPWPRPHSSIPTGHSDPEGSGRPGSSLPPRALTQRPHRVGIHAFPSSKESSHAPGCLAQGG